MSPSEPTLHDQVVFYFLIGSFFDLAETIFVPIYTSMFPGYLCTEPSSFDSWDPLSLSIVGSLSYWLVGSEALAPRDIFLHVLSWKMPFVA